MLTTNVIAPNTWVNTHPDLSALLAGAVESSERVAALLNQALLEGFRQGASIADLTAATGLPDEFIQDVFQTMADAYEDEGQDEIADVLSAFASNAR